VWKGKKKKKTISKTKARTQSTQNQIRLFSLNLDNDLSNAIFAPNLSSQPNEGASLIATANTWVSKNISQYENCSNTIN